MNTVCAAAFNSPTPTKLSCKPRIVSVIVSPSTGEGAIVGIVVGDSVATTGESVGLFVELVGATDLVGAIVVGAAEGIKDGVDDGVAVTGDEVGNAVSFMTGAIEGGKEVLGARVGESVSLEAVGTEVGESVGDNVSFDSVGGCVVSTKFADGVAEGTTEGITEGVTEGSPVRSQVQKTHTK